MKNILITGGAGFIGSHLALRLKKLGYSVTVLDNLCEQVHGKNPDIDSPLYQRICGKVAFIKGDITNRKDIEMAVENQDAIVHLASATGTGQSMYQIEEYNKVNVSGTALLMDVLVNKKGSVTKLLLASSRAVYAEGKYLNQDFQTVYPCSRNLSSMKDGLFEMVDEHGLLTPLPTDENAKLHPVSFYGLTKLQQEQMVQLICPSINLDFVILRYQNVYGEGQSLLNPYTGILSIFSTQILNGNSINIFEDGLSTRDFINIDDVVEATVRSLETEMAKNKVINIGTGMSTSIIAVAEQLYKKYGREEQMNVSGDFRVGDVRHNFADLTAMKDLLQYTPEVNFEKGMESFAEWVLAQPVKGNNYRESLYELKEKGFLKS